MSKKKKSKRNRAGVNFVVLVKERDKEASAPPAAKEPLAAAIHRGSLNEAEVTFLTESYHHQDELSWSRTQLLFAIEAATLAAAFTVKGYVAALTLAIGTCFVFVIQQLIHRDWECRDKHKEDLEKFGLRPSTEPQRKWRTGRILLERTFRGILCVNVLVLLAAILAQSLDWPLLRPLAATDAFATPRPVKAGDVQPAGMPWGTVADWFVVLVTLIVAIVAVFQESIWGWWYRPTFRVSAATKPPDCIAVPFNAKDGTFLADTIHLRLLVKNTGNVTARNAEVYAKELRRRRLDGTWERVERFSPMNLCWSDIGTLYFPHIAPEMGKYSDIAHITDPARRSRVAGENSSELCLTDQQCGLAFSLIAVPNHCGHIVGPGSYQLDIIVAADNARPLAQTIEIDLPGPWNADPSEMMRKHLGLKVLPT